MAIGLCFGLSLIIRLAMEADRHNTIMASLVGASRYTPMNTPQKIRARADECLIDVIKQIQEYDQCSQTVHVDLRFDGQGMDHEASLLVTQDLVKSGFQWVEFVSPTGEYLVVGPEGAVCTKLRLTRVPK
jgi:hypothetical protein